MATECKVDSCDGTVVEGVDGKAVVDVNLNDPIAARVYENILACRKQKIRSSLGRKSSVVYPVSAFNLAQPKVKREGSPPMSKLKFYKFNW